jgi:hypothetical protein
MKFLRKIAAVGAITATVLLTTGCYKLHISANVDQQGVVTGGKLEMLMAKDTFDRLAAMGSASSKDLKGFEDLVNQSSKSDGSPAAGQYINGCSYSETTIDQVNYYSAACPFDKSSLNEKTTVDKLLGLTGGSTVVSGDVLTISGGIADASNGDASSMEMAKSMGLELNTTLHFANKVKSVEGAGVTIDKTDPTTVVVDNLAASGAKVTIAVEIPNSNITMYVALGVGVAVIAVGAWFVIARRKNATAE